MESFQQLNALAELRDNYFQKIKNDGQEMLKAVFSELFEKVPNLKMVTWRQYTPYFNDGEPCTFGVGEFKYITDASLKNALKENGLDLENSTPEDYEAAMDDLDEEEACIYVSEWKLKDIEKDESKLEEGLTLDQYKLLVEFDSVMYDQDDLLEIVFNDHVKVKATREGFEVSEYDHD